MAGVFLPLYDSCYVEVSSSTAAACVAHALGYCDSAVSVYMPGGVIEIKIDGQYHATMTGEVRKVCEGVMSNEALGLLAE